MRQFNYQFVGEYGQSQPVWVSAKDEAGDLVGGLRGFVFLHWLNVELLFVDAGARRHGWVASCLPLQNRKLVSLAHATPR